MKTPSLAIVLVLLAASYGWVDVGFPADRGLWAAGMYGVLLGWFALAGALIGGVLWTLERAFAPRKRRRPGPAQFRLYSAIGAIATWSLLMFRVHAYAPRITLPGG